MADQFVMCARLVKAGKFTHLPGPSRYLRVPEGADPSPDQAVNRDAWFKAVRAAAVWGADSRNPEFERGDVLVFVHGYNNSQHDVVQRHGVLKRDLQAIGFKGEIVSFDWPSDDDVLNYLGDRHTAKKTAMQLMTDGICELAARQTPNCTVNVHLLAHSTGAYVVREAFDDADDARLPNQSWTVSQLIYIAGDVSSDSMADNNPSTDSLYRHCLRLTNYSNLRDSVLKLSNAKRLGMAPRAGRVGLPALVPDNAVNVDCSDYYASLESDPQRRQTDQDPETIGTFCHSWFIGNKVFTHDLFETLKGDLDRNVIPTRVMDQGNLLLKKLH